MRDGCIAMPSFTSRLNDQEIVEITNYVRSSWGNSAAANNTKALEEKIRVNPGL
jgi:mono/diheme cytochrome c family protein